MDKLFDDSTEFASCAGVCVTEPVVVTVGKKRNVVVSRTWMLWIDVKKSYVGASNSRSSSSRDLMKTRSVVHWFVAFLLAVFLDLILSPTDSANVCCAVTVCNVYAFILPGR